MAGVVFTPAAGERISRAVRWVEAQRQAGGSPLGPSRGVDPVWVRLTSGTADANGHYPGVITLYSGVAEAWSDYSAVKVAPLNGETLSNATRYSVRPSGRTPAGDELYTVLGVATAAASGATVTVKSLTDTEAETDTGYYGAIVATMTGGGYTLSTAVWLRGMGALDGLPATHTRPVPDQYYPAVLAPAHTIDGDTRPVALIPDAASAYYGGWIDPLSGNARDIQVLQGSYRLGGSLYGGNGHFDSAVGAYVDYGGGLEEYVYLFPSEVTWGVNGDALLALMTVSGGAPALVIQSGGAVSGATPVYAVDVPGITGTVYGQTGTLEDGSVVTGGIVTGIGAGITTIDGGTW